MFYPDNMKSKSASFKFTWSKEKKSYKTLVYLPVL